MKRFLVAVSAVLALSVSARAEDLTGRLGAGGALGAAIPIGSRWVTDHDGTGLGLGGWLSYGLSERWSVRASYDNLALGRGSARMEPLQFSGAYALCPKSAWNPSVRAGVGPTFLRGVTTSSKPTFFGAGAGIAVDRFLTPDISVGAALDWFAAFSRNPTTRDAHILRPALTLGYWFGGARKTEVRRIEPAVQPKPAKAPERVEIALNIEFDTAKAAVKPRYDDQLKKVAVFLKEYPSTRAEIEGHTDNVGAAAYNRDLSQRRAEAVRQALISRFQVAGSRLTAKGYGPDRPIADNKTREGRARNRRVVAVFAAIK